MAGEKIRKEKPSRNPSNHFQGGVSFHKSKGQHILKNPLLVDTIVEKSGIKSSDVILEIGPGTGNLTKKLLEVGKMVIAVEVDPRMVLELQRRFQGTPHNSHLKGRHAIHVDNFPPTNNEGGGSHHSLLPNQRTNKYHGKGNDVIEGMRLVTRLSCEE
ncbi:hypothetical protein IFM89_000669 [Coptis chinensis]|uniref:rRNA adenine N(6)-methyltransferase n=1 Tax=Coptis chinensis TaxID=261450 RepID=A0A835IFV9_9MAGN|nr:hypothetical protein IFM89_000669 [Coptis chinensis]